MASKKSVKGADITLSSTGPLPTADMRIITGGSSSNQPIPALPTSTDGNYKQGREARDALMRGVRLVNDAVKTTLGPKGKDAVLGAFEWPYSIATNDGASIAERVKSNDPFEQMGVRLIQEAIGRANKESGDGSTTTCVLTAAILEEGSKHEVAKGQLDACLPQILDSIDRQTKPISPEEVWKVAAISAQDEEMGKMIGEIYQQIGPDGVIDWDNSYTEETTYEIKDGVELKNVSFVHPAFINYGKNGPVNNPFQGDRIVVINPKILITAEKIHNAQQLEPYCQALKREGVHELVVLADEIEPMALAEIEATGLGVNPRTMQQREPFKIIILKAPSMWKDWIYEDFARMTGATIFGVGQSAQFKGAASLSWLGTCDKIIARRGGTDVIGTQDISEHIATLKVAANERQDFHKRVEWLNSKSAVVKMGARSEVELSYKRLKFDDARHAAKLALQGGVVEGAGIALIKAANVDSEVLQRALVAPYEQICLNMGAEPKETVYDPTLVVKNSVKAAISVAGTVLNTETLIPYDPPTQMR